LVVVGRFGSVGVTLWQIAKAGALFAVSARVLGVAASAGRSHRYLPFPHSSSPPRFTPPPRVFLLSQSREQPGRQREPSRFATVPSSPILQACLNTTSPDSEPPGPSAAGSRAGACGSRSARGGDPGR